MFGAAEDRTAVHNIPVVRRKLEGGKQFKLSFLATSMLSVVRRLQRHPRVVLLSDSPLKHYISSGIGITHGTDSCGIPLRPSWSVNKLLSSYPSPFISSATLKHLHELSALTPPEEGTPEFRSLKQEMEELVRLVEAVKLVETDGVRPVGGRERDISDGRIFAEATGGQQGGNSGHALLRYAARTSTGFYVVDADKKR